MSVVQQIRRRLNMASSGERAPVMIDSPSAPLVDQSITRHDATGGSDKWSRGGLTRGPRIDPRMGGLR